MAQPLSGVFLPIVFSTKERFPFLSDEDVRREVHVVPAGIAKKLAKGDTALSDTLTATSSLVCVFTIPWIVAFSMDWFLGSGAAGQLPFWKTLGRLTLVTIVPIV
jgi:hypothetical protein